jgi:hypothetical protein
MSIPFLLENWSSYGSPDLTYNREYTTVSQNSAIADDPSDLYYTGWTQTQDRTVQCTITFNSVDTDGNDDRIGICLLNDGDGSNGGNGAVCWVWSGSQGAMCFLQEGVGWGSETYEFVPQQDVPYTFKAKYILSTQTLYGKVWRVGDTEPDWQVISSLQVSSSFTYSGITFNSYGSSVATYSDFDVYANSGTTVTTHPAFLFS